jgi:Xaa-Pro aminopeptidase
MNTAIMQAGGATAHTTVSCGGQTADPNETGHGLLLANAPIILEVSPRSQKTGYYGNIARTVVRGRASEAFRAMYHAVASAQELALAKLTEGIAASHPHRVAAAFFKENGFRTQKLVRRMQGFLHDLGNGIGLELEESPRLHSSSSEQIQPNQVLAVGPGLYYPELGGVRLKDLVLVTRGQARNLTKFEKVLEI